MEKKGWRESAHPSVAPGVLVVSSRACGLARVVATRVFVGACSCASVRSSAARAQVQLWHTSTTALVHTGCSALKGLVRHGIDVRALDTVPLC